MGQSQSTRNDSKSDKDKDLETGQASGSPMSAGAVAVPAPAPAPANGSLHTVFSRYSAGAIEKLCCHVVKGEQAEAKRMVNRMPELLTMKATVVDYSGRRVMGTPLQLALAADDIQYRPDEECMVEMLEKHLKLLPDGETIIATQTAEWFPVGWVEEYNEQFRRGVEAFNRYVQDIKDARSEDGRRAVLQMFKDYLEEEKTNRGVIHSGKLFCIHILAEAIYLSASQFGCVDTDNPILDYVFCHGLGELQRHVQASYAQAFSRGVTRIVRSSLVGDGDTVAIMPGEKLTRSLVHKNNAYYYPLDSDPTFRLGEGCVRLDGEWISVPYDRHFATSNEIFGYFGVLVNTKARNCSEFIERYKQVDAQQTESDGTEPKRATMLVCESVMPDILPVATFESLDIWARFR
ncbi:MAG TPA: hypothetical protein VNC84_00225 [Gammaproteobacteria bacterium]|jgi:hypothetical protein|nr:hypothetical protein [Gammaproteobacteria bacterium]